VDSDREQPPQRHGLAARMARALGRRPGAPEEPEWLEAAVDEFERRMRETEERLTRNVSERLEGAIAELRAQGDARLADELQRVKQAAEAPLESIRKVEAEAVRKAEAAASRAEKSSAEAAEQMEAAAEKLGARTRRQELKLIREENSKRVAGALERLERQAELRTSEVEAVRATSERTLADVEKRVAAATSAVAELGRRLDATEARLAQAEARAGSAEASIRDAVTRLQGSIAAVEEAEERVLEIGERVGATARRIAEIGDSAERAVDWESRMAAAMRSEAEAAQRITDAERRLLERVDPDSDPS
jgi:colicin import membrane protein